MLKSMHLKNITVFKDDVLGFSPALNVVIGENSMGKSHLLKMAYSLMTTNHDIGENLQSINLDEKIASNMYVKKLINVFRTRTTTNLVRLGETHAHAKLAYENPQLNAGIYLERWQDGYGSLKPIKSELCLTTKPVYFPTRELLTIYPGFVSLYNTRFVKFEETWRDTCDYLGVPLLRDEEKKLATLLAPLEAAIGGKVVLEDNGEFYLDIPGSGKLEMSMVAEGYRKLAMLAHLIANGMIAENGYLFWDEPESNLNAKLIRVVAEAIVALSRHGVQVFLATHSLFLLNELEILLAERAKPKVPARFIGLVRGSDGGVEVRQGDHIDDIGNIVALDENLKQSDRYLMMDA